MDAGSNVVSKEKSAEPINITPEQLWREIASLKELILSHITRIDNAVVVAHADVVRFPTKVQEAVTTLKNLHEEKFNSIKDKISDAAHLTSEKFECVDKANNKQEANFSKQIDAQFLLITTTTKTSDDKIVDLKDRLGKIETLIGSTIAQFSGRSSGQKDFWGYIVGAVGLIAAVVAIIMSVSKN